MLAWVSEANFTFAGDSQCAMIRFSTCNGSHAEQSGSLLMRESIESASDEKRGLASYWVWTGGRAPVYNGQHDPRVLLEAFLALHHSTV